jgi:hypothetical protein
MLNSSLHKFAAGILMSCLTIVSQAQALDSRWRLRVMDLKHEVRVEATVRFVGQDATESCMGGTWRRMLVEAKTTQDEKFFPLAAPLAYELAPGKVTIGLTATCDAYLLLSAKSKGSDIQGTYDSLGMAGSRKLGYFSLKRIQ